MTDQIRREKMFYSSMIVLSLVGMLAILLTSQEISSFQRTAMWAVWVVMLLISAPVLYNEVNRFLNS